MFESINDYCVTPEPPQEPPDHKTKPEYICAWCGDPFWWEEHYQIGGEKVCPNCIHDCYHS